MLPVEDYKYLVGGGHVLKCGQPANSLTVMIRMIESPIGSHLNTWSPVGEVVGGVAVLEGVHHSEVYGNVLCIVHSCKPQTVKKKSTVIKVSGEKHE